MKPLIKSCSKAMTGYDFTCICNTKSGGIVQSNLRSTMKTAVGKLVLVLAFLEASKGYIVNKEPCKTDACNPYQRLNRLKSGDSGVSKWQLQMLTFPSPFNSSQPIDALEYLTQDLKEDFQNEYRTILKGLQGSPEGTWSFKRVQWDRTPEQVPLAKLDLKLDVAPGNRFPSPLKKIDLQYFVYGDGASIEVTAGGGTSLVNLTKSLKSDWDSWSLDTEAEKFLSLQVTLKAADKFSFVLINLLEAAVDCSAYAQEDDCEYATTSVTSLPTTVSTLVPSDATSTSSTITEGPSSSTSTVKPTEAPISSTTVDDTCVITRTLDSNTESWIQNSMGSLRYFRTSAELTSADILPEGFEVDISKLEANGVWLQLPPLSPDVVPINFQLTDPVGIRSITIRYFAFGDAQVKISASQNGYTRTLSPEELVVQKARDTSLWQEVSVHFVEAGVTELNVFLEATSHAALLMDSITATVPCPSEDESTTTSFVTSISTETVTSTTAATSTELTETSTDLTPPSTTTLRSSSISDTGTTGPNPTSTMAPTPPNCDQLQVIDETSQTATAWKVHFEDKFQYFETSQELQNLPGFPETINVTQLGAKGVWLLKSPILAEDSSPKVPEFALEESNNVLTVTVRYFSYGNASLTIEAIGGKNDSLVDNVGPLDSSLWRQMQMSFENVGAVKVIPTVMSEDSLILIDSISAQISCTSEDVPNSSTQPSEEPEQQSRNFIPLDTHPSATCKPKRPIDTAADVSASGWQIEPLVTLKYYNHSEDLKRVLYFPKEIDIDALDAKGIWVQRDTTSTEAAIAYFLLEEPNGVVNVTVRYYAYGSGSVVIEAFGSRHQKAVEEKLPADGSPWRYLSMQVDEHVTRIKVIPKVAREGHVAIIDSITAFANCEPLADSTSSTAWPGDSTTDASATTKTSIWNLSLGILVLTGFYY